MALNDHAQGVTHKNHFHTGVPKEPGKERVITGQAGKFTAFCF
jgi:hypothetical protein